MQNIWNILLQHSPFALIKEILEKDTSAWESSICSIHDYYETLIPISTTLQSSNRNALFMHCVLYEIITNH